MASAGRAVVFAGTTVVISMLGLLLVGIGWVGGVGVAVSATVLATMLASTTLLPALGLAQAQVEMTLARTLAAGFGAVALLGAGFAHSPSSAPCWLCSRSSRAWRCARAARCRGARPHLHGRPGPIAGAGRSSGARGHGCRRPSRLFVIAFPVTSMRLGWPDEGNFPEDTYTAGLRPDGRGLRGGLQPDRS